MKRLVVMAGLAGLLAGTAGTAGTAAGAGEIAYVSGGIGDDEQGRLLAREGEFNLKLVFTLTQGNYVTGVNVGITDGGGRMVVQDADAGPLFMARLPAGQYTIAATYEGRTVTRAARVGAKGLRTEYLRWPSNPQTDLPVSRWLEPEEQPKAAGKRR